MPDRSPFPGMDPWLEGFWESAHARVAFAVCDQVRGQLPPGLFADIEVTVYILGAGEDRGRPRPDVAVVRSPAASGGTGTAAAGAVATPYLITIPAEPVEQLHVVIRSLHDGEPLVTAAELLSPTNKRKRMAREAYVAKRAAYHAAGVNLLELDLIRGGGHLIDLPLDDVPAELVTPYKACVHRGRGWDDGDDPAVAPGRIRAEYYPLPLRERLPRVGVPLRPGDPDVGARRPVGRRRRLRRRQLRGADRLRRPARPGAVARRRRLGSRAHRRGPGGMIARHARPPPQPVPRHGPVAGGPLGGRPP